MWKLYRKTFVATQVMIVSITLMSLYLTRGDSERCAILFMVMQLGAVAGAWYGDRLRRRIDKSMTSLPLQRAGRLL